MREKEGYCGLLSTFMPPIRANLHRTRSLPTAAIMVTVSHTDVNMESVELSCYSLSHCWRKEPWMVSFCFKLTTPAVEQGDKVANVALFFMDWNPMSRHSKEAKLWCWSSCHLSRRWRWWFLLPEVLVPLVVHVCRHHYDAPPPLMVVVWPGKRGACLQLETWLPTRALCCPILCRCLLRWGWRWWARQRFYYYMHGLAWDRKMEEIAPPCML